MPPFVTRDVTLPNGFATSPADPCAAAGIDAGEASVVRAQSVMTCGGGRPTR